MCMNGPWPFICPGVGNRICLPLLSCMLTLGFYLSKSWHLIGGSIYVDQTSPELTIFLPHSLRLWVPAVHQDTPFPTTFGWGPGLPFILHITGEAPWGNGRGGRQVCPRECCLQGSFLNVMRIPGLESGTPQPYENEKQIHFWLFKLVF